jgi:hypothetical protein
MGLAKVRWIVGAGAVLIGAVAFYVLMNGGGREPAAERPVEGNQPALDDIDAESRAAMRDLLREADGSDTNGEE